MLLNGKNGILIKNNNLDELTDALEDLLIDDNRKQTISNRCKGTVGKFKAADIYLKWKDYIEKVVLDEKNKNR